MLNYARQSLGGWRNEACAIPISVPGVDLAGHVVRAQIRLGADTPGAPLVDLMPTGDPNATGVYIGATTWAGGVPTSHLMFQVTRAAMQALPYMGEMGDPAVLAYALQFDGQTRMVGAFIALASPIDSDNAPANRPMGYGGGQIAGPASFVTLTIAQGGVSVSIDGVDLLTPLVNAASSAASAAQNAMATAQQQAAAATAQALIALQGSHDAGAYLLAVRMAIGQLPAGAQLPLQATTRTVLAAFTGQTAGQQAYLTEPGCYGLFTWSSANLSAAVAADPRQALYVAPATNASGASGAWQRQCAPGVFLLRWYRVVADGLTNNTAAVTAWLAHLHAAFNAEGIMPCGTVVWDGGGLEPFGDNSKGFATITLRGVGSPSMEFGTVVPDPAHVLQMSQGSSILRTFSTVNDCFIVKPSNGGFSGVKLVTRWICFRTYDNPQVSGLNAGWAVQLDCDDTAFDTGVYSAGAASQPTTTTATGLITPYIQNAAYTMLRRCVASGYYAGYEINEHTDADGIVAAGNWIGRKFRSAYHGSRFGRVNVMRNHINIYFADEAQPGRHAIVQQVENIEHNVSFNAAGTVPDNHWTQTQYDVYDMANGLRGQLPWWVVDESSNDTGYDFKKAGGRFLHCYNVGDGPAKKALFAITNGQIAVPSGGQTATFVPFTMYGTRSGLQVRASDPTYIDVLEDGDYDLEWGVEIAGMAGAICSASILYNGTADANVIALDRQAAPDAGPVTLHARRSIATLSAGDYLRCGIFQSNADGQALTAVQNARTGFLQVRCFGVPLS